MLVSVLKSKISYAVVTQKDLYYVGSVTIDVDIMERANIRENELLHVVNLNNGERLQTYVIPGDRGSQVIGLNGPAARRVELGDQIFLLSYVLVDCDKETVNKPIIIDLRQGIS